MASRGPILEGLKCPSCTHIFTDPRILPCGHTLCEPCIFTLIQDSDISCLVCSKCHRTPEGRTTCFVPNFAIVSLLGTLCKRCVKLKELHRCTHCSQQLCQKCTTTHKTQQKAEQSLLHLNTIVKDATIALDATKSKREQEDGIMQRIDSVLDELRLKIDERRSQLKCDVLDHMSVRENWSRQLGSALTDAETYIDSAEEKLSDDGYNFCEIIGTCDDKIAAFRNMIGQEPDSLAFVLGTSTVSEIASFGSLVYEKPEVSDACRKSLTPDVRDMLQSLGVLLTDSDDLISGEKPKRKKQTAVLKTAIDSHANVVDLANSDVGNFDGPSDVAVCPDTGYILVADQNRGRVLVLDGDFNVIQEITKYKETNLTTPRSVCGTHWSHIVIVSGTNVLIYDENGSYIQDLEGPWKTPRGVSADRTSIYVCDSTAHLLRTFSSDGVPQMDINLSRGMPPGCPGPFRAIISTKRIVFAAKSDLYYIPKTALKAEGQDTWIVKRDVTSSDILALAMDRHGKIYIGSRLEPIIVLDPTKEECARIGVRDKATNRLNEARGLAITKSGKLIVANCMKNNLLTYPALV